MKNPTKNYYVIRLPPVVPEVTEYLQDVCRCKDCGELVYTPLPNEVRRKHLGSSILALVAVPIGMLNTSKREALVMINEVFPYPSVLAV